MKLPGQTLRLSNQEPEKDKEATVFKLFKTTMTTWSAHARDAAPNEARQNVTRSEIAALFATELASSARRI